MRVFGTEVLWSELVSCMGPNCPVISYMSMANFFPASESVEFLYRHCVRLFQVKIWFQNRRTKWKKTEYGTGVSDSETKLAGDDVMASKSHLEVCRGVTLTSDSLSSTSSSSPSSRYHSGQTSVPQDHSEPVQTSTVPADKVMDMSVESELAVEDGYSVQSKRSRWENIEEERFDDDHSPDDVELSDYKNAVDLSTSKSFSADADQKSSQRRGHVSSESDLDGFPDTGRQRSSLLQSQVVFSRPRSPVLN